MGCRQYCLPANDHPPGLWITVYHVIEGKEELRLPTPNGRTRPGWWLHAMAYAYASCAPPLRRAVPRDTRALVLVRQCPMHVPHGTPPPPGTSLNQVGGTALIGSPLDKARMELGHHKATLTPPGGSPLVITTPMVAKATYDKARVGLVLVPSVAWAPPAEQALSGRN